MASGHHHATAALSKFKIDDGDGMRFLLTDWSLFFAKRSWPYLSIENEEDGRGRVFNFFRKKLVLQLRVLIMWTYLLAHGLKRFTFFWTRGNQWWQHFYVWHDDMARYKLASS